LGRIKRRLGRLKRLFQGCQFFDAGRLCH
jgi:hypothetical protein